MVINDVVGSRKILQQYLFPSYLPISLLVSDTLALRTGLHTDVSLICIDYFLCGLVYVYMFVCMQSCECVLCVVLYV